MPNSTAVSSLRANSQDRGRSLPSHDHARSAVIKELLACRENIQSAEEGFYEQRRRDFVELYETAYRLVRMPEALRSFMESPEVLTSSARMPTPGATPEQCLVYLVRFAYSGPTKRMQKRASKFAKMAQLFVAAKITPAGASALLLVAML